jgi:succinyl-CoA synthetase alpha subunit
LVDGLKLFFEHEVTKGVIVIRATREAELNSAELIEEHRIKAKNSKPMIEMVAGRTAPGGKTAGHAGTLLSPRDPRADTKTKALDAADAVAVVLHPGLMGSEMKGLLEIG